MFYGKPTALELKMARNGKSYTFGRFIESDVAPPTHILEENILLKSGDRLSITVRSVAAILMAKDAALFHLEQI